MGLLGGLLGGLGSAIGAPFKMMGNMLGGGGPSMGGGGFLGGMGQGLQQGMGRPGGGLLSKLFSAGTGIGPQGAPGGGQGMPMAAQQANTVSNFMPGVSGPRQGRGMFDSSGHPYPVGPENAQAVGQQAAETNKITRQNIATYTQGGLPRTSAISAMIDQQVANNKSLAGSDYYQRMAQIESHYNPVAVSKTGAKGLFQFTGGTWGDYGKGNPLDPVANTDAAIRLTDANYKTIQKRLGRAPDNAELYMAHNIGAGGFLSLYRADPNTPVTAALIGSNPDNNPKFLRGKDGKSVITARQALENYRKAWPTSTNSIAPSSTGASGLSSLSGMAASSFAR